MIRSLAHLSGHRPMSLDSASHLGTRFSSSGPYLPMPQKVWEEVQAQIDGLATSDHEQRERFRALPGSRRDHTMHGGKVAA
jgi:hypothetical protein